MKILTLLLLLLCLPLAAQERQPLQGKVVVDNAALSGAFIINKQTKIEVKTDSWGGFTIEAKTGDRLVVYSNATNVREFSVGAETFKTQPYVLAVEAKAEQLDEVVIETPTVTSEGLGLVPENQKRYTVAERRLNRADSGPVDILLNWISGRKKMLKRELATEQKEAALDNLNGQVNEDELSAKYGIPAEMVQGFLFYAIEDPRVTRALNEGNDNLIEMLIIEIAADYVKLQKQQPAANTTQPAAAQPETTTQPTTPQNE